MNKPTIIIGTALLAGVGFYFYEKKTGNSLGDVVTTMTQKPGYTSMMKLPPSYYNNTSTEGVDNAPTFASAGVNGSWALPADPGNAMTVSAGYGTYGDKYSSTVANAWLQGEAQGAHL